MSRALLIVALLLPAAMVASAAKFDATQVVTAQTKEQFVGQEAKVRDGMQGGGRYEFVTSAERTRVEARLVEIENLLDHYMEGTRLQDGTMMALLTAQEEINGILTRRDGDRLICKNEIPTGSHRPVNNCKKYSDIVRAERATQKQMRDYMAVPCSSSVCAGH